MLTKSQRQLILLSSLGGVLEFYDFIIFALLASYIAEQFFPTENNLTALIATFATFAVGYLVRPLGGIIFGHFGDKLGRKVTFTISILMMALATLLISFVPSYASIGLAAPIILMILRVFQGLSIGGEIPGAIAYLSESIPERKGFACGIIFCFLISGIALGSLVLAVLNSILSHAQMVEWGWRIPFFLGGIFGIVSYYLRKKLEESALFKSLGNKTETFPIVKVFQVKFINAVAGMLVVSLGASTIALLFLFTPAYVSTILHQHANDSPWLRTLALFLTALLCILFGALSDKVNHKKMLVLSCLFTIVLIYPLFYIYNHHFNWFAISLLLSAFLTSFVWGVIPPFLSTLFPTQIRYSGIGLSYNLGFAIFGGLTPMIATTLIYETHSNVAPIYYLMATAVLCMIGLIMARCNSLDK